MERFFFDAAAILAILFAGLMVLSRNPVKSVLALVVSFFFLAVCFVMLYAPFIAAIQVIVYAGAILVLFLFVLMLLNIPKEIAESEPRPIQRVLGGAAVLLFTVILVSLLSSQGASGVAPLGGAAAPSGEVAPVARALYAEFLLPFEALSVLLLAALVGAYALVEKEKRP